jgi:hypothetical protein
MAKENCSLGTEMRWGKYGSGNVDLKLSFSGTGSRLPDVTQYAALVAVTWMAAACVQPI